MWLFNSKTSFADSGILRGATDWHCHLLPGVDDGIKTLPETLDALARYEELGIKRVWFTPHIMEDMPNRPDDLRRLFSSVQAAYGGTVELRLAAEHMLDNLFEERLAAREVLPIGEEGDLLLVETSYFTPPYDFWGVLGRIQSAGYHPLLAHPERYLYMDPDDYRRLHDMGVLLQLNLPSLAGAYGPESKARAKRLLKLGYYAFKGTDTHRISGLTRVMNDKDVEKSCLKQVENLQ